MASTKNNLKITGEQIAQGLYLQHLPLYQYDIRK